MAFCVRFIESPGRGAVENSSDVYQHDDRVSLYEISTQHLHWRCCVALFLYCTVRSETEHQRDRETERVKEREIQRQRETESEKGETDR